MEKKNIELVKGFKDLKLTNELSDDSSNDSSNDSMIESENQKKYIEFKKYYKNKKKELREKFLKYKNLNKEENEYLSDFSFGLNYVNKEEEILKNVMKQSLKENPQYNDK